MVKEKETKETKDYTGNQIENTEGVPEANNIVKYVINIDLLCYVCYCSLIIVFYFEWFSSSYFYCFHFDIARQSLPAMSSTIELSYI